MLSRRTMTRNRLRSAYFRIEHELNGPAVDGDTPAGQQSRAGASNGAAATTAVRPEAWRPIPHACNRLRKAP